MPETPAMRDQANIAHPKVWTIDKSIPLALIVTIVLQGGIGVWWASNLSTRTETMEKLVAALQEAQRLRDERAAAELRSISERTVRLEVGMEAQRSMLEQVARRLDVSATKAN